MLSQEGYSKRLKKLLFEWPERLLPVEWFPTGSKIRFGGYVALWGLALLSLTTSLLVLSYQIGGRVMKSIHDDSVFAIEAKSGYAVRTILGFGLLVMISISVLSVLFAKILLVDLYRRWFKEQKEQGKNQIQSDCLSLFIPIVLGLGIFGTAIPFYFIGAFHIRAMSMVMCGDEEDPRFACYFSTVALGIGKIALLI